MDGIHGHEKDRGRECYLGFAHWFIGLLVYWFIGLLVYSFLFSFNERFQSFDYVSERGVLTLISVFFMPRLTPASILGRHTCVFQILAEDGELPPSIHAMSLATQLSSCQSG